MAVTNDAVCTATAFSNTAVTTITNSNLTVGSGSNRALVAFFMVATGTDTDISGVTATWDPGGANQALTKVTNTTANNGNQNSFSVIYALLNPVSGNKSLTFSWTTAKAVRLDCASFNGVDQSSFATSFINGATHVVGTVSVTSGTLSITSATNDMVVANFVNGNFQPVSFSGTTISLGTNSNNFTGTMYQTGASTVNTTCNWGGGTTWLTASGCDLVAAASTSNPFSQDDWPNPPSRSWFDYFQFDGPLPQLLSKDRLPNRQMDWPTPIGAEPNPRRSWEYWYNLNLIGKDRFFGAGGPDYDYLNRPMPGPEPDWRRSWEWSYNRNLIGQDKLPFRNDYLNRPLPNYIEPDWRRSWEFTYNPNLIGKDIVPGDQYTNRPDPVNWLIPWTLSLLQSTLTPAPSKPISQYDWPNPPPVIWYRSWEEPGNTQIPFGGIKPFNQNDWPLPYPITWYREWQVNLSGQLLPPFSQTSWSLTPNYPPLVPSWTASYNLNLIGQDRLPIRQQDWKLPLPVTWYQDFFQDLTRFLPTGPMPFSQTDWPNPGPIPFRDYGYINFTVNIPSPPPPPVGPTTGGRQVYDAELALASRDWHSRQLEYAKDSLLNLSNKLRAEHSAAASRLGKLGADSRWNKK